MREIKFRAWLPKEKKMVYNVPVGADGFYHHCISEGFALQYDPQYEKLPVMQFTGLKDSNGEEIYEGDIVLVDRIDPVYDKVKDKVEVGFLYGQWNICDSAIYTIENGVEIIGNIYENPNLINGKACGRN